MIDMSDELWKCFNQLEEVESRLLELYKKDRSLKLNDFYNDHVIDLEDAWREHEVILDKIEELRCV